MIPKVGIVFFLILPFLLFNSCTNNNQKELPKPVFNETDLRNIVLQTTGQPLAAVKIDSILSVAEKDSAIFKKTISFLSTPYADPNSDYRNEDLYLKILNAHLQSAWFSEPEKKAIQSKLNLTMQNRVGTVANNFTYLTPEGAQRKMFDVKSDYTMIFFYNPECEACKEIKAAIGASSIIQKRIQEGALTVLAIYTDKDESIWLKHLPEMPKQWIHGRDVNEYLYKNNIYNLKAIPTLYLLDMDKKVLCKDCINVTLIENKIITQL